ncbi:UV excision repair protein RAD23 homolog B-like [Anopheles nili]|uniref:UV excision repair protein RAD23 homolog B-like n=1 Tax=Anopheles nili TaxID=185578 RepID=UPI00237A4AC4|nr:UV excision repair protein RAD23 homolog B-like [Anopheles nili]
MKITLKTLKQQTFFVEVDVEKDTVLKLKEKLYSESGQAYSVDRQRLIYLGKIMEDDHPLSRYNLDDKKFIVVMNKKLAQEVSDVIEGGGTDATTESKTVAPTPAQAKDTKPEGGSSSTRNETTSVGAGQNNPSTSTPPSASTDQSKTKANPMNTEENKSAPSTEAMSPEMLVNIQRLKEMGYSEQSARIALEICANIPDRAVEYLLSEVGSVETSLAMDTAPLQAPVATGAQHSSGSPDSNPLAFMRNNPVFQDMKRIVRDDPTLLPYLLRRIQTSNPDLLEIIRDNQEEFLALLNEGPPSAGHPMSQELEDIAAAMVNSLTPSDMDAIERLKALGYPEHLVIQAYIACERDEYNAAEFLVSQMLDEEE